MLIAYFNDNAFRKLDKNPDLHHLHHLHIVLHYLAFLCYFMLGEVDIFNIKKVKLYK